MFWGKGIYHLHFDMTSLRKYIVFSLLFVMPTGFFLKFYAGPGHYWFNNYGAGILYEIFWILTVFFVFPEKKRMINIVIGVFLVTCTLEFLQLWHPGILEKIRSCFIGSALIGTSFSWWDFPHYAIGCLIGWTWINKLAVR